MEAEQDLIEAGVSFGTGEMVGSDLELREKLHQSSSCGNNNDDQDKDWWRHVYVIRDADLKHKSDNQI